MVLQVTPGRRERSGRWDLLDHRAILGSRVLRDRADRSEFREHLAARARLDRKDLPVQGDLLGVQEHSAEQAQPVQLDF